MKNIKLAGLLLAYILVFFSVSAPDLVPGQPRFQYDTTHSGRPLTPQEITTLEDAIDNIATPPPDSLTFTDENGDTHTVSCWVAAYDLICQLHEGRIEAETIATGSYWTLPDSQSSPDNDQMNIDPGHVAKAATSADYMRALEGCLIHEWWHKNQDTASLRNRDKSEEIAPYNVMSAYYCSTAVTPGDTNDHYTKWARDAARSHTPPPQPPAQNHNIRPINTFRIDDYFTYLQFDTASVNPRDSLMSFSPEDPIWQSFPLFPFRGSDLLLVDDALLIPPGHTLVALFGGFPTTGVARIWLLDYFEGQVIAPVWDHDFGPPSGDPPMFFYSVTKQQPDGPWFVLDTLNHQILMMEDSQYDDEVPDEIVSIYASATQPGMEFLLEAKGLEAVSHSLIGQGVMVLEEDVHMGDSYYPHDWNYFLADTDGDLVADAAAELPLYEFLSFTPDIQVVWDGEMTATVFGPWQHTIEVWTTDSEATILVEMLGATAILDGVGAECPLLRPVETGEFLISVDAATGSKLLLPTEVIDPTPYEISLNFDSNDGMLKVYYGNGLKNCHYELWSSDDSENFYNTGLTSPDGNFEFPPPALEKQFYQIRAVR